MASKVDRFDAIVATLTDYMSEKGGVIVPAVELGDLQEDADALVQTGLLVKRDDGYAFFHERYLDYAFAVRLSLTGQSLLDWLLGDEQHLRRRTQVRQVLEYQRDRNVDRYLKTLGQLLTSDSVRPHIKEVIFDLLAARTDPMQAEWEVVAPFVHDNQTKEHQAAFQLLNQPAWVVLLDEIGWLGGDVETNEGANLYVTALRQLPAERWDRHAKALRGQLRAEADWDKRITWLSHWMPASENRAIFELLLEALDAGLFEDREAGQLHPRDLFFGLSELPNEHADWAAEFWSSYLARGRALAEARGESNPFRFGAAAFPDRREEDEFLAALGDADPAAYLGASLPFILDLARNNVLDRATPPLRDSIWGFRDVGGGHGLDDLILSRSVTSLEQLTWPAAQPFVEILRTNADLDVGQYLLFRFWASHPEQAATEAFEYLVAAPEHLESGYTTGPHWAARQLIEAIVPKLNDQHVAELETAVLDLPADEPEDAAARFTLLGGIPADRRSEGGNEAFQHLQSRFGQEDATPPPPSFRSGFVQSPIDQATACEMSDEEWLEAIAKYASDEREDFFVGGADQLAQVLRSCLASEPTRYAALGCEFPDGTNHAYFDAILLGLGESIDAVDQETLWRFMRRCHELPDRPLGRWISHPVSRLSEIRVPDDIAEMVAWYAEHDPDPTTDVWKEKGPSGDEFYGGDPHGAGINSNRGTNAEALASIIWSAPEHIDRVYVAIEAVVNDPTIQVRTCAAVAVLGVFKHDKERGLRLFKALVDTDDVVLASPPIERFLFYASRDSEFAATRPILERMLASKLEEVQRVGARQFTVAALDDKDAREALPLGPDQPVPVRIGVADVLAANLPYYTDFSAERLPAYFEDEVKEVRDAAADCLRQLKPEQLGSVRELLQVFIESRAYEENANDLFYALEEAEEPLPEEQILACQRFVELMGAETGDFSRRAAFDARTASDLIVRAYAQAESPEQQSLALDVIDQLAIHRAYGLPRALTAYEEG